MNNVRVNNSEGRNDKGKFLHTSKEILVVSVMFNIEGDSVRKHFVSVSINTNEPPNEKEEPLNEKE